MLPIAPHLAPGSGVPTGVGDQLCQFQGLLCVIAGGWLHEHRVMVQVIIADLVLLVVPNHCVVSGVPMQDCC